MNFRTLTLFSTLLGASILWSCGGKENKVTIDIVPQALYGKSGDTLNVKVTASSELENIKSVTINITAIDTLGAQVEVLSTSAVGGSLTFDRTFDFTVGASLKKGEAFQIKVTVTDDVDGVFEGTNAEMYPVAYMAVLRSQVHVGHLYGPINIGYDLVTGEEIFRDSPNNIRDMMDRSEQKKDLAGSFNSHNQSNTKFVDIGNGYDITSLHTVAARDFFEQKTPSTIISVAEGTKFLASLRGGTDFAVVHITGIDTEWEPSGQTTENKGRYTLDIYKFE
ncbi:MAG: hypothetical protein HYZ16_06975 [Bacteroidetes bacterium]|jgi:hypothetical protein|nr:hypothetical protein [Bacteroidota bacterium]